MSDLEYVKEKIQKRINSMSNDKAGNYAKKMMRRCIKDIDAVIDAKKVTEQLDSISFKVSGEIEPIPMNADIFKEAWSPINTNKNNEATSNAAEIVRSVTEISLDKKRLHEFNILKKLLDSRIISNDQFLNSILDGTI